ncbi:nidogen-like domain-containing protein [Conyzicola sp.]|uniref:nidogen-like domain-containing protein n=1 Tax=Conyzicola sp. TaxID=1969404 RepID=UPI0039894F5D
MKSTRTIWKTIATIVLGAFLLAGVAVPAHAGTSAIVDAASCMQHDLASNDDASSAQVDLPFPINFYGHIRNKIWINNNGNVTFNGALGAYTPFGLADTREAIIAPFFADVDTRPAGAGAVQWGWGELTYDNHRAFCVNWTDVGYYSNGTDKTNSFQLMIVDRSSDVASGAFDIIFNYGRIQWETGSASGGVNGLGGSSAVAGFASGDGLAAGSIQLPGSAIPGSFLDSSPTALVKGKLGSNIPGRYVFNVRGDGVVGAYYVALGDSFQSGEGAYDYSDSTDTPDNRCHRSDNAYPNLLVSDQVVHLQLRFRACSGAVMADLDNGANGDGVAQFDALGVDTKLVTIGIAGNDLDFSGTVTNCVIVGVVSPTTPWVPACQAIFGAGVDDKLRQLEYGSIRSALGTVYNEIKNAAPYARIIAISYPKFFPEQGALICPTGIIRLGDQLWMNNSIGKADRLIGDAAKSSGVEYVNMADVTKGHEICSSDPAQNGVVLGPDNSPKSESYHPNALGHRLMANRIEEFLDRPVVPTFTIQPQARLSQYVDVTGRALNVAVNWPGSDVVTTLVSPSGTRITRESTNGAVHTLGPTFETWRVDNPEPGQWTIEYYGAEIAEGGEPVTVNVLDEHPSNIAPVASYTEVGAGRTFTFDASGSSDADGSIAGYTWDFGDQTSATGPVVQHTFPEGSQFQVMLAVADDRAEMGFASHPIPIDTRAAEPTNRFSSDTTLTDSTRLGGPIEVDGDLECNTAGTIDGDTVVTGDVHLTDECQINGSLVAGGTVHMTSRSYVTGSVTSAGSVTFEASAKIGGQLTSGGIFIPVGATRAYIEEHGAVGGTISEHAQVPAVAPGTTPIETMESVTEGNPTKTWQAWVREAAIANNAPSWSSALSANPGCTVAPWASSLNGANIGVGAATIVDARLTTSGCETVTFQGMTVNLSGDLTLLVDNLRAINGIKFQTADASAYKVKIITLGSVTDCATDRSQSISGGITSDPAIAIDFFTPGRVSIVGPAHLTGSVTSGCWNGAGSVSIAQR